MTESLRLVPAVMRAAAILDRVAAEGRPMRLTELAASLGLPKSSAHGLCQTLVHLHLLRESPAGFVAGPGALGWAAAFDAQSELVRAFHDLAAGDAGLAEFTLTLSVLDGFDVVYLACRNATAPLGITFRIGMRIPAVFSATGKAMLAALPERAANMFLTTLPSPLTGQSVDSTAALRTQITRFRAQGYSEDRGEVRIGMTCVGAAILDHTGQPTAGIAISMTTAEAENGRAAQVGRQVAELAYLISRRLG